MQNTPASTDKVVRSLRFSQRADKLLRARVERKGDLCARVIEALTHADLRTVEVPLRVKAPGSGRETFFSTSMAFDCELYEQVTAIAAARNVSTARLIDAAVIAFFARKRKGQK